MLDGEELRNRLDHGRIPLRKAVEYAQQIVSGLSAAHEKGIVHRDLKPENLFITKDTPKAVFKTRMLAGALNVHEVDVSLDGRRFLIGTLIGEPSAPAPTVILNWPAALKK